MKVTLIGCTQPMKIARDPELMVASCAKGCYSEKSSEELFEVADEGYFKTLDHIVASGHGSVVEHLSFTFSVEGISRACANQLVRHRMASYSQQSQRYVKLTDLADRMIIPPSIQNAGNTDVDGYLVRRPVEGTIDKIMSLLTVLAEDLRNQGVPEEDIRYFYPIGMKTNISVTMNARSLLNFFTWRCCNQAQWEIRELADRMLEICKRMAPTIFRNAGPECVRTGCHEGKRSCGGWKK